MISIQVQGGLGNILFQISAALSLAHENNTDIYFPNFTKNGIKQGVQHNFNIDNHIKYVFNDLLNIDKTPTGTNQVFYQEPSFIYNKINYQPDAVNNINGYFQSEKYFLNNQEYIKKVLNLKHQLFTEISDKYIQPGIDYVSVHVRRGDYLYLQNMHPVLPIFYYKQHLDHILSKEPSAHIFVFSDDLNFCKQQFTEYPNLIFIDEKDYNCLYLMSKCKYHIMANSSFSWWAAKYAEWNNDEIFVIEPPMWFGVSLNHDTRDLIPEKWVQSRLNLYI